MLLQNCKISSQFSAIFTSNKQNADLRKKPNKNGKFPTNVNECGQSKRNKDRIYQKIIKISII